MNRVPATQSLKPLAQRRRELADQIAELQGKLKISMGIKVLHVATCGHPECGNPEPLVFPDDAWVVQQGCKHLVPDEVTPEAINQQVEKAQGPSPIQRQAMEALAAMGPIDHAPKTPAHEQFIPIRR